MWRQEYYSKNGVTISMIIIILSVSKSWYEIDEVEPLKLLYVEIGILSQKWNVNFNNYKLIESLQKLI